MRPRPVDVRPRPVWLFLLMSVNRARLRSCGGVVSDLGCCGIFH